MYIGDFALGTTFDFKFTTRQFSTGAPYLLAGSPSVAAYPGNSTTEITAGITLTANFDSRAGLTNVRIVATSGNGYATATNYAVVITAGTVDSVSVVGEVGAHFSIENRSALRPTTAGRTLDVSATGEAGLDWANIGGPTTAQTLSGTTVKTATDVETDTQNIQSRLPAALVSGRIDADVGAVQSGAINEAAFNADTSKYQAKVWLVDDNTGSNDRYVTVWYKNGEPIFTGITSPTIQVIKVADGTDLVASTAMAQIGATGMYRYDEGTNRLVDGAAYVIKVQASIDSSTRTWIEPIGINS